LDEFKNYILEGKTIPELMQIYNCSRSVITSAKKKYGLVGITPNSKKLNPASGTRVCNACGQEKELNEFYSNGKQANGKIKYKPSCKQCSNKTSTIKKNQIIAEYLYSVNREYKCEICGYNKNYAAIEFHHIKESEKVYEIGSISKSIAKDKFFEILKTEIPKCIILCANCHREWHNPNSENRGC
jgi:hypothetical protein